MVLWLFTDAGSGQISSVAGWLQVAESTGCWREIPGPNANWLELIEQRQKSQWHCSQKRLAGPASLIRAWRYEWCHIYQVWDAHSGVAGWATGCDRMTLRGGGGVRSVRNVWSLLGLRQRWKTLRASWLTTREHSCSQLLLYYYYYYLN